MISMQFKTWLRLHEEEQQKLAPETMEQKQQKNSVNHIANIKDVIVNNGYNPHKFGGLTHSNEADLTLGTDRDSKTHTRVELKSVSNTKSGNPQQIKITHRLDDPLVGSHKDPLKDLTVAGLEDLLKHDWKRSKTGKIIEDKDGSRTKSTSLRLSTPSYAVYEHIRDNHPMGVIGENGKSKLDELLDEKKFNNPKDFDEHFENEENRKNWTNVSTQFWHSIKTPMNFDVIATSLGHVMCAHKEGSEEYNRALQDCIDAGLIEEGDTFTDDINYYNIRGGFAKSKRIVGGGDTRQSRIQREHKSLESQELKSKRKILKDKLDLMEKTREDRQKEIELQQMAKGAGKIAKQTTKKEFKKLK